MSGTVWVILPLACLSGGAFAIYLMARLVVPRMGRGRNGLLALLTALILVAALGTLVPVGMMVKSAMEHMTALPEWGHLGPGGALLRAEPGALVVAGVALGLGVLVAVYSGRYLALDQRYETYYPLLLMLITGLLGMVQAADLFNLYLFCELMSLAAYALVAFRRHTDTAIEAGFKYLMMGSVGTAIMLMGISFLYRARGHLALPATLPALPEVRRVGTDLWGRVGLACVMVGLAVKSAIVPLHTWLPDAHGRAPSSISAMLSGIVIQSTFYVALKVSLGLGFPRRSLGTRLILLSVLNMTLGNGMALVQTSAKRLLAYSTIAQMGYVMLSIGIRYEIG